MRAPWAAILGITLFAQPAAAQGPPAFKDSWERISYALGVDGISLFLVLLRCTGFVVTAPIFGHRAASHGQEPDQEPLAQRKAKLVNLNPEFNAKTLRVPKNAKFFKTAVK